MFLFIVSIVAGFLGLFLGSVANVGNALGIIGFFGPSIYVIQKIYLKLEALEEQAENRRLSPSLSNQSSDAE